MIAMIASKSALAAGGNWLIEEVGQVPVYNENAENPWVNLVLFPGGKGVGESSLPKLFDSTDVVVG